MVVQLRSNNMIFKKLQMEITVQGKQFVLKEANPSSIKMINNKTFTDTVQQGAQL